MSKMQIEITSTSVSKKGTIWMQVKLIKPDDANAYYVPATGEKFECTKIEKEKGDQDGKSE